MSLLHSFELLFNLKVAFGFCAILWWQVRGKGVWFWCLATFFVLCNLVGSKHLDCGSWRILGFGDGGGDLCLLLAVYTLPRHNPDGLICCAKLLLSGVKLLHATSVHCSWSAWTCIASHCIDLNHTFALQYCPAHCLSVHFAKPPLLNIGVEPICESGTFEKLTLTLRKLKWSKPNVSLEKRKYSSGQRWSYRRSSCKT